MRCITIVTGLIVVGCVVNAWPATASEPAPATLKDAAGKLGVAVGSLLARGDLDNLGLVKVVQNEFSIVTATCYPATPGDVFWRGEGRYDPKRLAYLDRVVQFAAANRIKTHWHPLLYADDRFIPAWLKRVNNPVELERLLRGHIEWLIKRYPGVEVWDVVNEAIDPSLLRRYRDCHYQRVLGEGFIRMAFEEARRHAPAATLLYNDFSIETGRSRYDALKRMLRDLADAPIDGVGWQMHVDTDKVLAKNFPWRERLGEIADMGLQNHVTELDIKEPARNDDRLSAAYQRVVEDFLTVAPASRGAFQTWGIHDADSWRGAENYPLLFDARLQKKPAYQAVLKAFARSPLTHKRSPGAAYEGEQSKPGP